MLLFLITPNSYSQMKIKIASIQCSYFQYQKPLHSRYNRSNNSDTTHTHTTFDKTASQPVPNTWLQISDDLECCMYICTIDDVATVRVKRFVRSAVDREFRELFMMWTLWHLCTCCIRWGTNNDARFYLYAIFWWWCERLFFPVLLWAKEWNLCCHFFSLLNYNDDSLGFKLQGGILVLRHKKFYVVIS